MIKFPILYKKDEKGRIREWEVEAIDNKVCTRHGLSGGSMQVDMYETFGKSIGTKAETSDAEQAILEAQSKWTKQIKFNRYFPSKEEAEKSDISITPSGGVKVQKAYDWRDHKHKMPFPCYVQPKLDGMRATSERAADESVLMYRNSGMPIAFLKHIKKALEEFSSTDVRLDGEIYLHGMPLNEILSIAKKEKNPDPIEVQEQMKFYIFDAIQGKGIDTSSPFEKRWRTVLDSLAEELPDCLVIVETVLVNNEEEAEACYRRYIEDGYEGMMYRKIDGKYKHGRSYEILKRKEFQEDEFKIVGIEEGKGRAAGLAINFICELDDGRTFRPSINGTAAFRKSLFTNPELWQGKYATVRFLNYSDYGIPVIIKARGIKDSKRQTNGAAAIRYAKGLD